MTMRQQLAMANDGNCTVVEGPASSDDVSDCANDGTAVDDGMYNSYNGNNNMVTGTDTGNNRSLDLAICTDPTMPRTPLAISIAKPMNSLSPQTDTLSFASQFKTSQAALTTCRTAQACAMVVAANAAGQRYLAVVNVFNKALKLGS